MSTPCTVIIGAAELLDALRESAAADGEVLTFERQRAVEGARGDHDSAARRDCARAAVCGDVARCRPHQSHQGRSGARGHPRFASYRSTAPIASLRAVRPSHRRVRHPQPNPNRQRLTHGSTLSSLRPWTVTRPAAQSLDYRGTRRAPRFRMAEGTEVQVDGALAILVDLSTHGAQILCPTPLKPQQLVRMVLADDLGMVKFSASVAWALFEIPKGVSRYRAGVEFKDAEAESRRCVLQTPHITAAKGLATSRRRRTTRPPPISPG